MRVLVAYEFSGVVRTEFLKAGHDVYSCDVQESLFYSDRHIVCDAKKIINDNWDMVIAFPPCTFLSNVGNRYNDRLERIDGRNKAIDEFNFVLNCNARMLCVENPVQSGIVKSRIIMPYTQIIDVTMFGCEYRKRTCLWLRNLPKLKPLMEPRQRPAIVDAMSGRFRSITQLPLAKAMAQQWG